MHNPSGRRKQLHHPNSRLTSPTHATIVDNPGPTKEDRKNVQLLGKPVTVVEKRTTLLHCVEGQVLQRNKVTDPKDPNPRETVTLLNPTCQP